MADVIEKSEEGSNIKASPRPINTELLLARCLGKRSFALSLLSELESTGAARVAEIGRLAGQSEYEAVVEAAHSLKGAVAILAAERARVLAAAIEMAGQARSEAQLIELVELLEEEMKRCIEFIPVFRADS